jgi:hypothetical protein
MGKGSKSKEINEEIKNITKKASEGDIIGGTDLVTVKEKNGRKESKC